MAMEGPAEIRVIALGRRFCDIMEKRCPTKPYIWLRADLRNLLTILEDIVLESAFRNSFHLCNCNIVKHFQSVGEIFLMTLTFNGLHSFEFRKLREYAVQKSGLIKESEADRRLLR